MVWALVPQMKTSGRNFVEVRPLSDGDIEKIVVEDDTPDGGMYFGHGQALFSGRRVDATTVPTEMRAHGTGLVPDYGRTYGLMYVSDKFKEVVERIEPGKHQFLPFQIIGPKKRHVADMWFMIVCIRIDSVDRTLTTKALYRGVMWQPAKEVPREYWPEHITAETPSRLVFNLSQIGGHHLWFDKHIGTAQVPYSSDILVDCLKAANVTGVTFTELEDV
jgi:hypothetical protein